MAVRLPIIKGTSLLDITVTPSLTTVTQNVETITFTEGGADLGLVSRRVYVFDDQGFSSQPNPSIKFFYAGARKVWVYFYSDSEDLLGYVEINIQVNSAGFPGDIIPNIYASYGLQKNNQAYTGPLVRILRNSDWAEQDFGVGPNGLDIDKTAVQNFLNHTTTAADFQQLPGSVKTPISAHSVCRRIVAGYNGPLVTIRRSSDNQETTIGCDVNGNLDTAAINSFIGIGDTIFVPRIWDQSGGGFHFTQTTLNLQGVLDITNLLGGRPKLRITNTYYVSSGTIDFTSKNWSWIMTFNHISSAPGGSTNWYHYNFPSTTSSNQVRWGAGCIAKGVGLGSIGTGLNYGSHLCYIGDATNNNTTNYDFPSYNGYARSFGTVRRRSTGSVRYTGQAILNSYNASTSFAPVQDFQEVLLYSQEMTQADMLKIKVNTDLYYNFGFDPLTSLLNNGVGYVQCIYNQTGSGVTDPKNQVSGGNGDKGIIDLVGVNGKALISSQGVTSAAAMWYGHEAVQQQFLNQETVIAAGFPTTSGTTGLYGGDSDSLTYVLRNTITYYNSATSAIGGGYSNINIQFMGIIGLRILDANTTRINFNNAQTSYTNATLKQRFFSSLFGERTGRRWAGKLGSFMIYNQPASDAEYIAARDILKNNYGISW